jgi:hypothetical protein
VGDVRGNDHEFGLAIVFGKLYLSLAHPELAACGIAFSPNLIEEIAVAQALENRERYVKHGVQESRGGISKASHLAA